MSGALAQIEEQLNAVVNNMTAAAGEHSSRELSLAKTNAQQALHWVREANDNPTRPQQGRSSR